MRVTLIDSSMPVLVSDACIARSSVLQQAREAEADATMHLPCGHDVWADWAEDTSARAQPLSVARLAHFLNSDTGRWAEAFWTNIETSVRTADVEERGLQGEDSGTESGALSPRRKQARIMDGAAAAAVVRSARIALLSEGVELVEAVLCMHPSITDVFDDHAAGPVGHKPSRECGLLHLLEPLCWLGLQRLCRSRQSMGFLSFDISAVDSDLLMRVLPELSEATSIAICFNKFKAGALAPDQERHASIKMARSVSPLLCALQPLLGLQRLSLSGDGFEVEEEERFSHEHACTYVDLSPLSALKQLSQLEVRGVLGEHPSAAVVAQLTHLQGLILDGYVWPLGKEQPQPNVSAACSVSDAREAAGDAAGLRALGPASAFPCLRMLSICAPRDLQPPQLPTAPQLQTLTVGHADAWYEECLPIISKGSMCNICSCIAAAGNALESVALSTADAQATALLVSALTQARQLRRLQVTILAPADASGYAAFMAAVNASAGLETLDIGFSGLDAVPAVQNDEAACASTVISGIAALTRLRSLHLTTSWKDPVQLERLVRTVTRLSGLTDLALGVNAAEFYCSVMVGRRVQVRLQIDSSCLDIVQWGDPEAMDVRFSTELLPPLAAWATANSEDATFLDLSTPFVTFPAMNGVLASLTALQSLRSVSVVLQVARHTEVLELATACCALQRLTSLTCMAQFLLAADESVVPGPEAAVEFCTLTELQELTVGGVRCKAEFEVSLQSAVAALPSLQSLSLRDIQRWPDPDTGSGEVDLSEVYSHLPATLTRLRLASISVRHLSARLNQLTQLKELELFDCFATGDESFELQPQCLPQLTRVRIKSDDDSAAW